MADTLISNCEKEWHHHKIFHIKAAIQIYTAINVEYALNHVEQMLFRATPCWVFLQQLFSALKLLGRQVGLTETGQVVPQS